MRKDELKTVRQIQPLDEWKCFICLQDKREMEIFGEDEKRIYLICDPCRRTTQCNLLENKTLRGL